MDGDSRILSSLDDEGVLHLTLHRPKPRNAFDRVLSGGARLGRTAAVFGRGGSKPAKRAVTPLKIASTTGPSGYAKAVDSILEEIAKGNVHQANFSQRLG